MLGETGACGNYAESSVCRWGPSASTTSPGRKRFWRVVLDQDGGVWGGGLFCYIGGTTRPVIAKSREKKIH